MYHGERVPWHRIGEQLQSVVTACSSLKNSQASGYLPENFFIVIPSPLADGTVDVAELVSSAQVLRYGQADENLLLI